MPYYQTFFYLYCEPIFYLCFQTILKKKKKKPTIMPGSNQYFCFPDSRAVSFQRTKGRQKHTQVINKCFSKCSAVCGPEASASLENLLKMQILGTSLVVPWLRLCSPSGEDLGSILVKEPDPKCCSYHPAAAKTKCSHINKY